VKHHDAPRESAIVAAIIRALKPLNGLVIRKRWTGGMAAAGDPDLTGCYQGRHFELEVKAPGGRLTRLQQTRLTEWRAAGAITGVVHSVAEALALLNVGGRKALAGGQEE
jgi:hypothetical protein